MERPSLEPLCVDDLPPPRRRLGVLGLLGGAATLLARIVLADLFFWRRRLRVEEGTRLGRFVRGLLYRLLFAPVLLVVLIAGLVYIATHPPRSASALDPLSQGIYYDPVSFVSADGVRLEGWLVPVVDAASVLRERERVLLQRQPAIVLVHDHAATRAQVLPLVRPFHEAGYIVLAISLRSDGGAACTFGLREAEDVLAAVEMLRRHSAVDAGRIAVMGVGTGANAAILAARRDNGIAALVLDHPSRNSDELLAEQLGPLPRGMAWMRPLCKWAFEIGCRVNAEEIDLPNSCRVMASRPVLLYDASAGSRTCFHSSAVSQMQDFLDRHLASGATAMSE